MEIDPEVELVEHEAEVVDKRSRDELGSSCSSRGHGEREQYAAYEEHAASVWADSATLLESLASARWVGC